MAGPLSPPSTLPSSGRRRRQSMAMPRQVLINESASAPPASAARAISVMSVTLGVSLARIGQRTRLAHAGDDLFAKRGVCAEIDPAADVRAGHVQFQGVDAGDAFEPGGHRHELVGGLACDADDDRRVERGQVGQLPLDEGLDAVVVQSDRVEHAAGGFDGPRRRIAWPRLLGDRLGQDPAQPREVHQPGHFAGVAEGARGHGDRVGQTQAAELNVEMDASRIHGRWKKGNGGAEPLARGWRFSGQPVETPIK